MLAGVRSLYCGAKMNGQLGCAAAFSDKSSVTVHPLPFLIRARETPKQMGFAGTHGELLWDTGSAPPPAVPCRSAPVPTEAVSLLAPAEGCRDMCCPAVTELGAAARGMGPLLLLRDTRDGSRVTSP